MGGLGLSVLTCVSVVGGAIGLLIQHVASWEQPRPIRIPSDARFSERKVEFSMHLGARIGTGDSGASTLAHSEWPLR